MFKKIAHNSTIPALGHNINQDLQPLQNLIAAEKAVLISLQKLSVDYSKASEALRTWSLSEGDDLEGILGASTSILNHFSAALSQYATHGHSMRDQLKAIRTKEESLDDLERRRRNILRKAEDADKKLSKMNPENKHYSMQRDTLNRLREDIRVMDSDIMLGEATLGDFKRSATKVWMGLKFGGLVECCEKGKIAGEFGRLAIAEISEEMTQPGLPRSFNYPRNKIENFVAEAYRGVNMVTLSTFPSAGPSQYDQQFPNAPAFYISMPTGYEEPSNDRLATVSGELQSPPTSNNGSSGLFASALHKDNQAISPFGGNSYPPEFFVANEGTMDDFGANVGPNGLYHQQQFPQETVNSSFSQPLSSSQRSRANEGTHSPGSQYQPQFSEKSSNPSFSQTSPSSGINEGALAIFDASLRSAPPYQQRFLEKSPKLSFSQTSPSSTVNAGAVENFGHSAPPHQQQLFETSPNPSLSQISPSSQQLEVNESAVETFGDNRRSTPPYQRQPFEKSPNPSLSQTSPSQQSEVNKATSDNFDANLRSVPPYQQQFSEKYANPSFSQASPSSQQLGNEGTVDNFDSDVRSTGPSSHQQFSPAVVNSRPLPPSQQPPVNEGTADTNWHSIVPLHQQQSSEGTGDLSFSQPLPPSQHLRVDEGTVENVGANAHPTGSVDSSNTAGGRSATFPVPTRSPGSTGGYSLQDPPLGRLSTGDSSFSASIANALHEKFDVPNSDWINNQYNDGSQLSPNSKGATKGFYSPPTNTSGGRSDSDPRPFIIPFLQVPAPLNINKYMPGQSELTHSRSNPPLEDASKPSTHSRSSRASEYDAVLAYLSDSPRSEQTPIETAVPSPVPPATPTTTLSATKTNEEDSRHVRFGGVEDVDQEMEKRVSLEKEQAVNTRVVGPRDSPRMGETNTRENTPPQQTTTLHVNNPDPSQPIKSASRRVPAPNIDSWEEDEKALNAATAREISLELEGLKNDNQNQLPSQANQRFQPVPDVDGGRMTTASTPRSNDQLPHPYAEHSSPGTHPHYLTSQPYAQATYQTPPGSPAQPFQQQQKQQALDMRNTLPPRFQAYNNVPVESQVPPRFQNSSSPIVSPLPPRFQMNYTPQASAPDELNS